MALWKKIFIALVSSGCLVFVALLILAKVMITPERVRAAVVPLVEESLERNLQLGEIEISIFSGIVINDLVLTERESAEPFVAVDKAVLRYRLWPLFLLKVEVDELRLERPRIYLTRLHDGSFNFSDLTEPSEAAGTEKSDQTTATETLPVGVYVSEIVIIDGTLVFVDRVEEKAAQQTLSALNLTVKDFSLTEPFQFLLGADWNGNDIALSGQFDLDDLVVDLAARLNAIQLEVKGDLLAEAKGDRLRAKITLPPTPIAELGSSIPMELVALPDTSALSGSITAELILDGLFAEPTKLLKTGRVELENITATTKFTENSLNGTVLLARKSLQTDNLSLSINDQKLDVFIEISDFIHQPLRADFTMRAARIDLDSFIPEGEEKPNAVPLIEPTKPSTGPAVQPVEIGPYDLPVEVNGTVEIDQLLYRGLPMEDFSVQLSLKNNLLTFERLTMAVAGGRLEQSGQVDLGVQGLRYYNQSSLQNVHLNPVVKALKPELAKSLFGVANGRINMSGAGTVESSRKQNLLGGGNFVLKQAKLTEMPALDSAAILLNMPELREIVIDDGQANFKVAKGLVSIDLKSKGPLFKQTIDGTITLDGQLGLKAHLFLSPQLSRKLDKKGLLRNVLIGKDGWSSVPLRVKGHYSSPQVSLDMQLLQKQAARGAIDSLADRLLKKARGSNKESETGQKDDLTKKLIDGALKGLFGN